MSSDNQYGLIILGNSGVGKSFLANILIGHDTFLHQLQPTSVTHSTESVEVTIGSYKFTIFNIPGLIEAEQERIDVNKQEIDKAFTERPNSIIMFVFSPQNGRIRGQDIAAFNAINAAYSFRPESLILVVNGIPKNLPSDYEDETVLLLQTSIKGVNINKNNVCFTNFINVSDSNETEALQNRLLPVVIKFIPQIHEKKQDIQTVVNDLKKSEKEIEEARVKLEVERQEQIRQIGEQKRIVAAEIAEQKKRTAQLQLEQKQRQARIDEANRRIEAQRVARETEAKILRDQIAAIGSTVPAGQTYSNNVVLSGNTFHVYGTMQGRITGHGTVKLYNGSKLNGGVDGDAIDIMASGSVSLGGNIRCRKIAFG